MRSSILLSYLFMSTGLLIGACTISLSPQPTPTPTQTAAPPASTLTTTLVLTPTETSVAPPGGITATGALTQTAVMTGTAVATPTPIPGASLTPTAAITQTGVISGAGVTTTTPVTTAGMTTTGTVTGTIIQVIRATPNLQTLASVLTAAGMADALELPGPFTIFAPTDEAFTNLPAEQEEALLNNPAALASVMQYHVVIDQVSADELARLGAALASSGQPITITLQADGSLLVNNAHIVRPDIVASNGIIHEIDQVLLPPAP